jgi:dolichol-phosphate mannosyltransferase
LENNRQNIEKMNMQNTCPLFSVVIPIYNEEENILELYRRLTAVLKKLCHDEGQASAVYEIIMVDDGSTDNSWRLIRELHEKDPMVKGINFSRNFGHHIAVLAGIDHLTGEYVILMDGDLQDPPEDIPLLVEKIKEGYDIVQGVASKRHTSIIMEMVSRLFHTLFVRASNVELRTRVGLFRCVRRPVIEAIKKLPERAIFFGGMLSWVGFKSHYVMVKRYNRYAGKTKYNFLKRFALAMNAITSFSERPLISIFQLGMITFMFSICMFVYVVYRKLFLNIQITGWTSLFAAIFFSTGLITLSLSVVGLYISKLFIEVKQRPRYIIKELTG